MSEGVAGIVRRNAFRFALTGIVGIWLSGCADATRFTDTPNPFSSNPFSNPFSTASNDSAAPTPTVSSQPLASAQPYNSGYATAARPSPVAVASAPPAPASTGAIRSQSVGGSSAGWTAVGGSPIIVGQSDDAASLSARYGVPEAALLSANGLHSRSELRPNMRIVIPVYNARGGDGRVAKAEDTHERRHAEDSDRDARKSERADAEHKKHKAEAKREGDGAQAEDERAGKKVAKAEKLKKGADKHDKDGKPEKHAKAEKAAKDETQVAKAEPAKLPRKADTDKSPTGNVAPGSSSGSSESGEFRWPARGRIIQGYKVGGNDGINIALPEGTSVRAAEDGKVAYAGSALKGYGNLVLIRHSNGFVSAYANNGELDVKSGDVVKRGQVIAKSGQTGDVSSPQLHFELRKGQTPVDPTGYLAGL
jgi:murein DD-endopeptidase MepM/ murein hydrolase activator NlpD